MLRPHYSLRDSAHPISVCLLVAKGHVTLPAFTAGSNLLLCREKYT